MTPPNDPTATDTVQTDQVGESRAIEIATTERRLELIALLGEAGRFDFEVISNAWGGDDKIRNSARLIVDLDHVFSHVLLV